MPLKYSVIEVFTHENARYQHKPLFEAILYYVRGLKSAARCTIMKGVGACYENGEVATQKVLVLSLDMPLKIEILLPSSELGRVLPVVEEMVREGAVGVRPLEIHSYKTHKRLIPKQIRVVDIMTSTPKTVEPASPLNEVVELLLSSIFNGIPVVNQDSHPIGIITQGDLIHRANMPLRLGLLAESDQEQLKTILDTLAHKKAEEIMTEPIIVIQEEEPLASAVEMMLKKQVKRLPVVNGSGRLVGMLARVDIFHTITRESPDWHAIREGDVLVGNLRFVSDIMHRDTQTVLPGTSIEEVIHLIDSNRIQRIAVVEANGLFRGLISDRDLLSVFSDHQTSIWEYLTDKIPFVEKRERYEKLGQHLREKTAEEVMKIDLVTVLEETHLDEAIRIMSEKGIKRLPVLDANGRFKGLISRDSLLRAGFAKS